MKLLSYGLDRRMEPRLAFSLRGFAVDVMRASLWMKEDRNAQDFLNLASSLRLALEDWGRSFSLLKELEDAFQSLAFENLSVYKRPVAMPESDIVYFPPLADPPAIRFFHAFSSQASSLFEFGQAQTLHGHRASLKHAGLTPQGEISAVIAADKEGGTPQIAGYAAFNNWVDMDQEGGLATGKASSMGPWFISADEMEPHKMGTGFNLDMQLRVNGQAEKDGRFSKMAYSFTQMLEIAAQTGIKAGDILCSGSPLDSSNLPKTSRADVIDLEIQVLGVLNTPIE